MRILSLRVKATMALFGWIVGLGGFAADVIISYDDNAEITVDAELNVNNNVLFLGAENTLKLTGAPNDQGVYAFLPTIVATNATAPSFTIDGSALAGATTLRLSGHMMTRTTGSYTPAALTVKGFSKIVFGDTEAYDMTATRRSTWTIANVVFEDGEGSLVFTNAVTMAAVPNCPWSVADGTSFWIGPGQAFPFANEIEDGVYSLDRINLGISYNVTDLPNEIRVAAGRSLAFFPFSIDWLASHWKDPWYWAGSGNKVFPCDVTLVDSSSSFVLSSMQKMYFSGRITGGGTMRYSNTGTLVFQNALDLTGTVDLDKFSSLEIAPGVAAAIDTLKVHSAGTVTNVIDAGASFTVNMFTGGSLDVQGAGAFALNNLGNAATLAVGSGVSATVNQRPSVAVSLTPGDDGAKEWRINGPADAATRLSLQKDVAGGNLTLGGKLDVGAITGFDGITIAAGGEVTGDAGNIPIRLQGGTFATSSASWQGKLALWLDASAVDSLLTVAEAWPEVANTTQGTVNKVTGDLVCKWCDRRSGYPYYVACTRAKTANEFDAATSIPAVFPVFVGSQAKNCGPSGFGAYVSLAGGNRNMQICTGDFGRTTVASQYAIVVFGSQNGGGSSLLALTDGGLSRYYATSGSNASKPIVTDSVNGVTSVSTNGIPVDPTAVGFNGGWQIVSVDLRKNGVGRQVGGMGYAIENGNSSANLPDRGRSEYAEVLLFGEEPTPLEIQQAEDYLAAKWGLGVTHLEPLVEPPSTNTLAGAGSLTLGKSMVVSGFFDGTVNLNGHTLELASGRLPFTAADIPVANRVAWFDPSVKATVALDDDQYPGEVTMMYQRDNAGEAVKDPGAFYVATACGTSYYSDYRPRYVEGTRALGTAAGWLDNFDGERVGNQFFFFNLDAAGDPIYPTGIANDTMTAIYPRTFFMVLDTSCGGGSPFLDWGSGNGDIARRSSADDPIWKGKVYVDTGDYGTTFKRIASGHTYLDGVEVNGTETPFSGRPEVLTFKTDEPNRRGDGPSLKSVGTYNNTADATANGPFREIVGEIIAFTNELDDATCADIEAYLMRKWFGKMRTGYADFTLTTVAGAGTVKSSSLAGLPQYDASFTGTTELTTNEAAFTLAPSAAAAENAVSISCGTLTLASPFTVNLAFTGTPEKNLPCRLLTAPLTADVVWQLGAVTVAGEENARLKIRLDWNAANNTLSATVVPKGVAITIR